MTEALVLDHLSKRFIIRQQRSRSFQQTLLNLWRRGGARQEFWALRDVSVKVAHGETLGVIGENGSGKSTILKLVARILEPTSGRLAIDGRVVALLEIGAGFHPDLTGRENIFLNGSVLGFSRQQLQDRLEAIVDFAELGDFIDSPIKHFSSGMHMRLGFAVAINLDPDVLLLDEVLAVGDEHFQHKCFERMVSLQAQGKTIILVSHDLGSVERMCQKALWLHEGKTRSLGPCQEVIQSYLDETAYMEQQRRESEASQRASQARAGLAPEQRSSEGAVVITDVSFHNRQGQEQGLFREGETLVVRLRYEARERVVDPVFGIAIRSMSGVHVTGPNTDHYRYDIPAIEGRGEVDYIIDDLPLAGGEYNVSVAVHDRSASEVYDYHERMKPFSVAPSGAGVPGVINLEAHWEHRAVEPVAAGASQGA